VLPSNSTDLIIAKRTGKNPDRPYFWGDQRLFTFWDGKPQYFNYMD
jgi:hypothetical protein